MSAVLPFVLMFAIFYFFLIRPQQARQKQRNAMMRSLAKGDKIVTIGGLHGTIDAITDEVVVLEVDGGQKLTFDRAAIGSVKERLNRGDEAVVEAPADEQASDEVR
jgi:preprotein translocase subunit YajC